MASVTKYVIASLTLGLLFTVFAFAFTNTANNYDVVDANMSYFESTIDFNQTVELVNNVSSSGENITADRSLFDIFGDLFAKFLSPVKLAYNGVKLAASSTQNMMRILGVPSFFIEYFIAVIFAIMFIGILIIKFGLGKDDEV